MIGIISRSFLCPGLYVVVQKNINTTTENQTTKILVENEKMFEKTEKNYENPLIFFYIHAIMCLLKGDKGSFWRLKGIIKFQKRKIEFYRKEEAYGFFNLRKRNKKI